MPFPARPWARSVFTAHEAEDWAERGEKVILVRRETSPEDVGGMAVAQGILTATGGKTSHAAVVARGWGKCCIVGCENLDIDYAAKKMRATAASCARASGSRSMAMKASSIPGTGAAHRRRKCPRTITP